MTNINTQFTQDNFRPFLLIPDNIIVNRGEKSTMEEVIIKKLKDYAESQPPIQVGGKQLKKRKSRKAKKKINNNFKTKSRK